MNNLSAKMQERLDKWKQNALPVKAADKVKGKQPNYLPRKSYGDEYLEEVIQQANRNRRENG